MVLATGTRHVDEAQLGGVATSGCPSLSSLRLTEKPGDVGRHHDLAHAPVAALVGGAGEQAQPVGLRAVGDVELRAVDDPLVAVADGPGAQAGHVGAGVGLGDGDGGHHLAARSPGAR